MTNANPVEIWYRDHHSWLQTWLGRRLSCSAQAADLAQDTFLRLLGREQPAVSDTPRALLTRIAKGLMIDLWRRQDIERAYAEAIAQWPPELVPPPEVALQVMESVAAIDRLLSQMPAKTRAVFWLAQIEERSYADIAAQLDMSLATVKRHLREALVSCMVAL